MSLDPKWLIPFPLLSHFFPLGYGRRSRNHPGISEPGVGETTWVKLVAHNPRSMIRFNIPMFSVSWKRELFEVDRSTVYNWLVNSTRVHYTSLETLYYQTSRLSLTYILMFNLLTLLSSVSSTRPSCSVPFGLISCPTSLTEDLLQCKFDSELFTFPQSIHF